MEKGPFSITITAGTLISAIAIGLLVWLLFVLQDLVLIVLAAIVLSSAVEPGVQWLMEKKISRGLAIGILYAAVLGVFGGTAYFLFPPFVEEARGFIVNLPQLVNTLDINKLIFGSSGIALIPSSAVAGFLLQLQDIVVPSGEGALSALTGLVNGLFSFLLIIVLSVYFAFQETGVDDFIRLVVPKRHEAYALDLWQRSHKKIGLWMQGQLILSLIMGVLGYLWLAIFQVPYAFLIAVFAMIIEIIPMFGSIISGTVAVVTAAVAGGLQLALVILGGFVVINLLQSHLIYPLVVKKVVGVPPLLVILAMIAGGELAGFLGVLLAVPVAATLQEFVSDIQKARAREKVT